VNHQNALALIQDREIGPVHRGKTFRVLGIDLGTTNSTVSECVWEVGDSQPPQARILEVVQPTLEGEYTHVLVPSVVAIHGGQVLVGEGAKRLRGRASELGLRQNENLFYECKNDIGNRRTYHRAAAGFRSAAEIGGQVVGFIHRATSQDDGASEDRVVVTVPASFQAAQRNDTIRAAELAGLRPAGGDLLDEPVAAFLDYLVEHGAELAARLTEAKTLVVFDFGGGTCDVAVFRLRRDAGKAGPMGVEWLAVSRYHRLGGCDIDAAIVHEALVPELCRQNEINPADLSFDDKKLRIEPALLGLAEMLKVGLCIETSRLRSFGKYEAADKEGIMKTQPGVHHCKLGDRNLTLSSPRLTAAKFEELLRPFLDRDLLFARETEYRLTCSVFAPLQDALDRAGVEPSKVDFCLAVGGSSLIPQVFDAVKGYFSAAEIWTYANRDDMKACVSRGAAYHGLALAVFGKGLVQPVCHDAIAVRTASGLVTLIPKGVALPYPADGSYVETSGLAVPRTVVTGCCNMRVEVVAAAEGRVLMGKGWEIPGPVNQGTPIQLEYRLDENQVLDLRARLKDRDDVNEFTATIDNPLTNVVNPQPKRMKIDELEEDLRTGKVPKERVVDKVAEIAELYADLGQHEKAIEYLRRALRGQNSPSVYLLNRLAGYYGRIGNAEREEEIYREAGRISPWSGTWFNLSLALKRHGKLPEAREAVDRAITIDREAPYVVQAALLAASAGDKAESNGLLAEAIGAFDPVSSLNEWELGWFVTAAQTLGDAVRLTEGRAEQRRRRRGGEPADVEGELPIATPGMMRPKK
jgi:molecular chaperone DnaK